MTNVREYLRRPELAPEEALKAPVSELVGITDKAANVLRKALHITTIHDLAESPYFEFSDELVQSVTTPDHTYRLFGVPADRLVMDWKTRSVNEITGAALSALEGIGERRKDDIEKALGVKTVRELAAWPPFLRAREILIEAKRAGAPIKRKVLRVVGRVVRADGLPVAGATVKIERQGIRKTLKLGHNDTVRTTKDGGYVFEYERLETAIDVRVELVADEEIGIRAAKTTVIAGAGAEERVDFIVGDEPYRGASSFDLLGHAVMAVLRDEDITFEELADFDKKELALLSGKTGVEPRELVLLKQSATLARETELPIEVFYGLGRQHMLLSLPALLAQDPMKRRMAVEAALAENQIPARIEEDAREALDKLEKLTVEEALRDPGSPGETTLGGLLKAAGLKKIERRRILVDAYIEHEGSIETFWDSIRTTPGFSSGEVDRVQLTLQLGAATQNHLPLVRALQDKKITELREIARLDKAEWLELIQGKVDGHRVGVPSDLKASGLSETEYAEMIFGIVEHAFPTAMVAYRVESFPDPPLLHRFFETNPGFEMRSTSVAAYLHQNPAALNGFGNEDEKAFVTKHLKGLERTYRIAPDGARVETMQVLLGDGVDSAQKIRLIGKAGVLRRYEVPLGEKLVSELWNKSNNVSAVAAALLGRHHAMFDRAPISVLPKRTDNLKKFPHYESLFGSLDFCSCEHCQSVYSPAAYLVDVLHWLCERKMEGKTALEVLFSERRADIGGIELSCKNTNTPLPYIDLVNEVLELLVEGPGKDWRGYQTTGAPADLLAHPEHLHAPTYEVLAGTKAHTGKDSVYPFNLPYNLWLDEARTYLAQLGVTRHGSMEVCHDGGPEAAWTDVSVATEVLGLSSIEWDVISGKALDPPRSSQDFWGMSGEGNWATRLAKVSLLLDRATAPLEEQRMGFDELAELLRADFVQEPGAIGVWFDGSTCDTTKAKLIGLQATNLDRLHRFIRLQRCLGWKVEELNRAIGVLGDDGLDEPFLVKLSHILRLAAEVEVPLSELLTWWGLLDTRRWKPRLKQDLPPGAPPGTSGLGFVFDDTLTPQPEKAEDQSQYDRLFQSPTTTAGSDSAFGLAPGGSALVDETKDLADHIATLSGALGITAENLGILLPQLADAHLSLDNLSALYRHVSLARALDLSVRQLVSVIQLTRIDPFDPMHTERTLLLVREVSFIRESGFSIEEVDYLLRHVETKPATQGPTSGDIGLLLLELRDALRKVESDHPLPAEAARADELRAQLASKLAVTLTAAEVTTALAVVDVPSGNVPPPNAGQIIDHQLKDFLDTADAKQKLADDTDTDYLSDQRARLLYVLGAAASDQELRDRLAKYLALVLPAAEVEQALLVVDVVAGHSPPSNAGQIIEDRLGDFLDPAEAKKKLAIQGDPKYLVVRRERFIYAIGVLVRYLRESGKQSAVIEKLSSTLGLDAAVTAPLLREHLKHPDAAGVAVIKLFTQDDVRDYDATDSAHEAVAPEPTDLPEQFAAYKRLHKAAIVLSRFRLAREELPWVMVQGPSLETLDLQSLPVAPPAQVDVAYDAWARLRDAVAVRNRLIPKKLFDLLEDAAETEADGAPEGVVTAHEALLSELERRSRWSKDDIEFLVGAPARNGVPLRAGALGFDYPADWKDEKPLTRLAEVMTVVRRIGLPASTLWDWRMIPVAGDFNPADAVLALATQREQADAIKQTVRARYDDSQWYDVARPLRDRLRQRQRDALASWLIARSERFDDVSGLFEHLLLDVKMSPCQLTSRIKQAISSVQLYVQRGLMNLEDEVEFSSEEAREWKWRKNYRVWEANRKVFLYPENWIEPELRDNKSPFFEELENDLMQSEITPESTERAFVSYLEKLDEVARLEVAGFFHQKEDKTDVLHVFGRTRGIPPRYFYRQRVDGSRWTPWEKVEVDIEGNHLLPVIYNRRLYIFWPQFTETALEEVPSESGGGSKPVKYSQIRLAWSEYRSGKWAGKRLSASQIGATPDEIKRLNCGIVNAEGRMNSDFFFEAYEQDRDLFIEPIRWLHPNFVRLDRFRLSGCDGTLALDQQFFSKHSTVRMPDNTQTANQSFARTGAGVGLALPAENPSSGALEMQNTLSQTPSPFEIVPHRVVNFRSLEPFFYQDSTRTFFVEPLDAYESALRDRQPPKWIVPELIPIDFWPPMRVLSPRPTPHLPDPWAYDTSAFVNNPSPIELVTKPALIATGDTGPGGLLAAGADLIGEIAGPRVAFFGGEALAPTSSRIAVESTAHIVAENPGELLELRSAAAPAEAKEFRVLKMNPTYFLPPTTTNVVNVGVPLKQWAGKHYRFDAFYHPHLLVMMQQLNRFGLEGLLDPSPKGPEPELRRQRLKEPFFDDYGPGEAVDGPHPIDEFDFSPRGAYSLYNWELFFHVPFLLASRLSDNQRFDAALRFFHYIFDPTESSSEPAPQRFWKLRPFFELFHSEDDEAGPIHELLLLLHYDGSDPDKLEACDALMKQIAEWRKEPFSPHAIARLRTTAYQKAVFMKYVDNLIEWGDQLFRRGTMESVNEASQLYVMAAQLLGRRPRRVEVDPPAPKTFNQLLAAGLDELSNALIEEVEGFLPEIASRPGDEYDDDMPVMGPTLFFCVPPNEKLVTDYWDRVADRLFKLRHCMNIEGIVRQLPLFEPPIDPALLVRAAAAGVDLASALGDLNAPLPHYRFQVLAQKATELCADVRGLGQALLSALEKKDAEELALLRAGHETRLQTAVVEVRKKQIDEAKEAVQSLKRSRENAEIRLKYYRNRQFRNSSEEAQLGLLISAGLMDLGANTASLVGSIQAAIPDADIGSSGWCSSPVVKFRYGGSNAGKVASAVATGFHLAASGLDRGAQMASLQGGYERRQDDWTLQGDVSRKEIEGLEKQIVGAEIRVAVAEKELDNLKLQIEHARETDEFLRDKYTNEQLYQWMVGQLSSLYFQSYKLAYDLAKGAERAWRFEQSQPDRSFIQFGYWDGLKKGLLAGERLHHDIKRMEVAHLDASRREYELARHVSLRMLDPIALLQLRRDGECMVRIPEAWFDLDSPGHYMRRIKTVAVSIPAVTGPYVPVRCTLTLLRSSVRISSNDRPRYARTSDNDPRFRDDIVGLQSVVTSQANQDTGLFETNLRDERYLPFEGAGVDSEWHLELPKTFRQFDYDTISDVVLHLRYTAREGGATLKKTVEKELQGALQDLVVGSQALAPANQDDGLFHLVSARYDISNAWAKFLNPPEAQADQSITLGLTPETFPFGFQSPNNQVAGIDLFLVLRDMETIKQYAKETSVKLSVTAPGEQEGISIDLQSVEKKFDRLPHGGHFYENNIKNTGEWTITFSEDENQGAAPSVVSDSGGHLRLDAKAIEDLIVVLRYKV